VTSRIALLVKLHALEARSSVRAGANIESPEQTCEEVLEQGACAFVVQELGGPKAE
jgi:hypothetical protein